MNHFYGCFSTVCTVKSPKENLKHVCERITFGNVFVGG